MSLFRLHASAVVLAAGLALASAACHGNPHPTLNVLSVPRSPDAPRVVYVEVVNPAPRPMRLQRLQYTFAADGATAAKGDLQLGAREVGAGGAVVVEVPLPPAGEELPRGERWRLAGRLWTEQDEIVRSFAVAAEVAAPIAAAPNEPAAP